MERVDFMAIERCKRPLSHISEFPTPHLFALSALFVQCQTVRGAGTSEARARGARTDQIKANASKHKR